MFAPDFNFATQMPWEQSWLSPDPTSGHNQWSVLNAAGLQCQINSVRGDENCAPRALVLQIVTNDPMVSEDASLVA